MLILFRNMAVFATITLVVYLVCMWFVRIEDQRVARRKQQRGS
jgi:hypothetical protein